MLPRAGVVAPCGAIRSPRTVARHFGPGTLGEGDGRPTLGSSWEREFGREDGSSEGLFAWGGRLAITMPRLPHLGRLAPNIYFAQGYSGQGVAIATLAGKLIAETITGQAGRFDVYERLKIPALPGGALLRKPLLALALTWYALRDRLG